MNDPRPVVRLPIRLAILAAGLLLLGGCGSAPVDSPEIDALRRQRRAETATPLAKRVALIEDRLFADFYEKRLGLITNFNLRRDGRMERGFVNVEQNAHLLIGLACKFAVTGDPLTQARAKRLVAGLDAVDRANGFDGFPPLEARVVNGEVEVVSNRFVASSYTQLLYAEVLAWRLFTNPQLKTAISAQSRRMLDHMIDHGLVVVDGEGRPLPYSDASLKPRLFGTARELETLSFVRMACFFARDAAPERRAELVALRDRVERDYGYARMPYLLHFSIPLVELPTVSSSWLNLMALAALVETDGAMKYRRLLHGLAGDYRSHQNPFFIALDLLYGPESSAKWAEQQRQIAWQRLATYPLTNDSHEMQNFGRPPYRRRFPPRYIKNSVPIEASRPIPFYDLAGDAYQWKRNLLLLHGNQLDGGGRVYSGVDCYEAYWLLEFSMKGLPTR